MDPLFSAAGLRTEAEIDDDAREALVVAAEAYLRAGGVVGLAEWASLSSASRAAMSEAGDRLSVVNALRIGVAAGGGSSAVMAEIDGGKALRHERLNAVLARAARSMGHGGDPDGRTANPELRQDQARRTRLDGRFQ